MKRVIRYGGAAALIAGALSLSPLAFAQDAVTQVTTTAHSDGTVTEFSPTGDTVVLRSDMSSAPVTYSYSKTTTVVDQNGNPVDVSIIKTGVPVQVYYDQDGGQMVARKIIVQSAVQSTAPVDPGVNPGVIVKKTTTTTTTAAPQ